MVHTIVHVKSFTAVKVSIDGRKKRNPKVQVTLSLGQVAGLFGELLVCQVG